MKNKVIIGLTGQSGAGKTTVSNVFLENGFNIINADKVSRNVSSMPEVVFLLAKTFGEEIILQDGTLNRKELGKIVFSNKEKLQQLNNIMFPIITEEINKIIKNCEDRYIVLDAPQLFEAGMEKHCNFIISVIAPHNVLIHRIMERDNIEKQEAENRLNSQIPEEFFRSHSDFVVLNDSTIENLKEKALYIINIIYSMEGLNET